MKRNLAIAERKNLAAAVADRLTQLCDDIIAAYVFGSFADGGPFSDMDLAILTMNERASLLVFEVDLEVDLERITGFPVDVRILNGAPLSFCQHVIRTGEVLVDSAPNLRADFEGRVLKKYFDFSRFRTRYLFEASNAPL